MAAILANEPYRANSLVGRGLATVGVLRTCRSQQAGSYKGRAFGVIEGVLAMSKTVAIVVFMRRSVPGRHRPPWMCFSEANPFPGTGRSLSAGGNWRRTWSDALFQRFVAQRPSAFQRGAGGVRLVAGGQRSAAAVHEFRPAFDAWLRVMPARWRNDSARSATVRSYSPEQDCSRTDR